MITFKDYLSNYKPFPWTITHGHTDLNLNANNELLINYVRFDLILKMVKNYFNNGDSVLDVGVYPGILPQLFHEYFPKNNEYHYHGVGLGFDDDFFKAMMKLNVELYECDLDPRLHLNGEKKNKIPIDNNSIDFIIFTDVIEHFFDPFYPLQEINRVSKPGSIMIMSTDNLTRFGSQLALIRGKSCNVPLINGNLFFEGDWRPHFREYSKGELFNLLQWSGFEVISHDYYESDFGNYRLVDGIVKKRIHRHSNIKRKIAAFANKMLINFFPHLRDNHLLIARKIVDYDIMMENAPKIVAEYDKWMEQRKKFVT
jgi:SAM-dependent methyltransferase